MTDRPMTLERAMNNAIVSTEMEGFTLTAEQRELMRRVLEKELTLKEAIDVLNGKSVRHECEKDISN